MGNSQSIQIAKHTKIKRFTVSKFCSVERAKCVPEQSFANALEESVNQSIQSQTGLFKDIRLQLGYTQSYLSRIQE